MKTPKPKAKIVKGDRPRACPARIMATDHGAMVMLEPADQRGAVRAIFVQVLSEGGEECIRLTLSEGQIYTRQPKGNVVEIIARRS